MNFEHMNLYVFC